MEAGRGPAGFPSRTVTIMRLEAVKCDSVQCGMKKLCLDQYF